MHIQRRYLAPIGKLLTLLLIFLSSVSLGQTKSAYYVKFKAKNTSFTPEEMLSPKAINRRAKFHIDYDSLDHPVNPEYIHSVLSDSNITLRYTLKWHNAIVVESNFMDMDKVAQNPYVAKIAYVGKTKAYTPNNNLPFLSPVKKLKESDMSTANLSKSDYGKTYEQNLQIGVTKLHQLGFDGTGVTVAVFDAGFYNIDKIPGFLKHQANQKITYGLDLVDLDNKMNDKDNHGTAVSTALGAYDRGKFIGSAPGSRLILFRTENASSEYHLEELNWCKAAELADSVGVDMITSSLGYTQFDDKSMTYTHNQLTGRFSYVSLGARTAVSKGIFVLNSAGNEGDDKWLKIGTPADVPEVLTIGAVNKKNEIGGFSSRGFNATGHVKPDVCALGVRANVGSTYGSYYQGYGTSYATPIAAGGVSCLLQAFPNNSPKEIADAIRATALNNNNPDSLQGYGVAQLHIALELLKAIAENKDPHIISLQKDKLSLYTKEAHTVSIEIYNQQKLLWIFKRKKLIFSDTQSTNSPITYVDLGKTKIMCSKKYTIKANLVGTVENHTLKNKDLTPCSD